MTQPTLVLDPARLSARHAKLLAAKKNRALRPDQVAGLAAALAECSFRLALSGDRPADARLQLLHDAARLDGTNPKFAYHLARLYFLAGELDAAGQWLRTAVGLCRTSHRLWAHVGLLQRELNVRYFGNEKFEANALRERAERIETKIADGDDQFEPALVDFQPPVSRAVLEEQARKRGTTVVVAPPAPATAPALRISRPKTCRWSGIHDLRVESLLQAVPTRQRLARLLPLLTACAAASRTRRGGPAGFAILGIQWVVSGYPVASVRRVAAEQCPTWAGPSRETFEAVCALAEAPRAELPARLAAALRDRTVPPLVAALLHRNRLLAPPEFRNFAALRAARRLLADPRPEPARDAEATDLVQKLLTALDALVPPPAEELADIVADEAPRRGAAELREEFERLEAAATDLGAAMGAAFAFLRSDLPPRAAAAMEPDDIGRVRADRAAADEVVAALRDASAAGLARTDAVVQGFAALPGAPPDNLSERREDCVKKFTALSQLGNFTRALTKLDASINALPPGPATLPTPALADLLARIRAALAAPTAATAPGLARRAQTQANEWAAALDRDWARAKELADIHARNEPPLSAAERAEAGAIRRRVDETAAGAEGLLEVLTAARAGAEVPADDLGVLDEAMKTLLAVGARRGPFARRMKSLPAEEPAAVPPPVTAAERPPPPPARTGVGGLARVLAYTEREIARVFAGMEATFAPYSAADLQTEGLRDLRFSTLARQAALWYRFGRRETARRVWSRLLGEDRLDAGVLRNLAVCDTVGGRTGPALAAWQNLLELLYFYDVVADDPRPHADARRDLHRGLSHAYAPAALQLKPEEWDAWQDKGDTVDVIAFLSSPAAVRNFVGHKLLEYFNARLLAISPTVLLGVSRADGAEVRGRAVERWETFQAEMTGLLPVRVRGAVAGLLSRRFAQAADICRQPQRLTPRRDPTYPDDHRYLRERVVEYNTTRVRVAFMLLRAKDTAGQLGSFTGLLELLKLDRAPFDSGPEFFEAAAGKLRLTPDDLRTVLVDFAQQTVLGALQFVLDEPTDEADALRRQQLFGKMVEQITPHERLQNVVTLIDGPHRSERLTGRWLSAERPTERLNALKRWRTAFPAMAGVAFEYAQKLLTSTHGASPEQNRAIEEEVIAALESGCRHGFYEPSIVVCARQLAAILRELGRGADALAVVAKYRDQATNEKARAVLTRMHAQMEFEHAVNQEQFDDAIRLGFALLADSNHEDKIARNLLAQFERAAQRTRTDPGSARLKDAVTAWAARARARWDQHSDNLDEEAVSPDTIRQVLDMLDETLVQIVIHLQTDADGNWNPAELAVALSELLGAEPHLASAYYHRMRAWQAAADDAGDPAEQADARAQARADAREVLARSRDPKQKTEASALLASDTE